MKSISYLILATVIISVIAGGVQAGTPHTVYGYCLDAADGTLVDGSTVTIYIQTRPGEKIYDTVGVTGQCELANCWAQNTGNFPTPWEIGEKTIIEIDNGAGYTANTNIMLTGAGADQAPNITLSLSGTNATKPLTNDSYVPGENQTAGQSNSGTAPAPPPIPAEISNISGINESKIEAKDTSINASETANSSVSEKVKEESPETSLWVWGAILLLIIAAIIGVVMMIRRR